MIRAWAVGVALVLCCGCLPRPPWVVDPSVMDGEVRRCLQLYPSRSDYRILIVPDRAAVAAEHTSIYGHPIKAPAFYSIRRNLIVIPRGCRIRILRHEIGHAVVEAYFRDPVPRWLHEELAQKAEAVD